MGSEVVVLLASFFLTILVVKTLVPFAISLGVVDHPGGRKQHSGNIPLIGGFGIYLSVLACTLLLVQDSYLPLMFLLSAGIIVAMGVVDDLFDLDAKLRLLIQVAVASLFVFGFGLEIVSFGNILGLGEIHIGWMSVPISILAIVSSMNAFNMLDGIDGLVGVITMVTFIGLSILFGQNGDSSFQLLCLAISGALSAFLIFNIFGHPNGSRLKKIFMGDAGSMSLGLLIGVLVIYGSQAKEGGAAFSPVTAIWFVLLPLLDMFSIMILRVARGKSPFTPDRTHLHHVLLRSGISRLTTLNLLSEVHIVFVAIGITLFQVTENDFLSFLMVIVVVALYQIFSMNSGKFIRWNQRRQSYIAQKSRQSVDSQA